MTRSGLYQRNSARLLLLTFLLLPAAVAQESGKTLGWADHTNINSGRIDPPWARRIDTVELEDIQIHGRSIMIGEPFLGDLRDIRFRVKNISNGPIGFIQITVMLPEIKISPDIPFVRASASGKEPKLLAPGAEADLRIPDRTLYDWVKDSAAKQGRELSTIKRATIYAVLVTSPKNGEVIGGCLKTLDLRNACPTF